MAKFDTEQLDQLRSVIREEVRDEVSSQLIPIHHKLDEIRGAGREDADALAETSVGHERRFTRVEQQLDLKPFSAQ